MSSYLDIEGIYDTSKRYIVNNWSDADFSQSIGSETAYNDNNIIEVRPSYSITVKAGEMRELGQFEALLFTKHFVNREMQKAALLLTGKDRERAEMGMDNRELRKPYEDKTIAEIKPGEATPFMDKIREEIRKEERAKMQDEVKETKVKAAKESKAGEFE
jgi:hypothetical protein